MAGPCALLADGKRMVELAKAVKAVGADVFRAGLWKGGTFPPAPNHPAWGLGYRGAEVMNHIAANIMPVATEIRMDLHALALPGFAYLWTPARMMQAYDIVRAIARELSWLRKEKHKPTLMIKRAPGATLRDCCGIIEHVRQCGYPLDQLWFIERGVVGIGCTDETRWRPDLLIVPQLKDNYPEMQVMMDVSHSTGNRRYVPAMALAAQGAGADGIMVEVLDRPEESPSDAGQTVDIKTLEKIIKGVR